MMTEQRHAIPHLGSYSDVSGVRLGFDITAAYDATTAHAAMTTDD
jgi:hypothetical protein